MKRQENDGTTVNVIENAQYGAAGQLLQLVLTASPGASFTQIWTYNVLGQLTRMTADLPAAALKTDLEYRYSATQNNGRITQSKDWTSGEEVTYAYDALNRLIAAATTGPEWGQSYSYDGFGNLISEDATKGNAPVFHPEVDSATNRLSGSGFGYDANGNLISATGIVNPPYPTPQTTDLEYRYPEANDGRISLKKDWVTGEEVNSTYGFKDSSPDSHDITQWLQRDCPKPKGRPRGTPGTRR